MTNHNKINYIEFPAKDMSATKAFYSDVFGWTFKEFSPDYWAFHNAGVNGGVYKTDLCAATESGSVLIVLFSNNLEQTLAKVKAAGGKVVKPIFPFPGGRRFHFADPNGNELAVWGLLS